MILVTGSTGLLGSHLIYALLQEHNRVAALKRPESATDTLREVFSYYTPNPDQLMERIDWRTGDLMDIESLEQALTGITCIVNCAAIISFRPRDRRKLIANNVLGTIYLAKSILNIHVKSEFQTTGDRPILIHISSISALGDGPDDGTKFLIDEETLRDPGKRHSGYSESKYRSEQALHETGVKSVILNPGIILGPGQWGKGSAQLFVKAWQGIRYYPYGGTGFVDVRDVTGIICRIISLLSAGAGLSLLGQRFCLVGANLRFRDFFDRLTDEFGKPNPSVFAGKILGAIAWRGDSVRALVMRRNPVLTRETVTSAQKIRFYSSGKICQTLDCQFRQISDTLEWVASCYKKSIGI